MIQSNVDRNLCRNRSKRSSAEWYASTIAGFNIQLESTGTRELERRHEAPIEKPTASESGTNSARAGPVIKNDGRKTANTLSIASRRGIATSPLALSTALAFGAPC